MGFGNPSRWDLHNIKEIMDNMEGWEPFSNPRYFKVYGRQKGWKRKGSDNQPLTTDFDFDPEQVFD